MIPPTATSRHPLTQPWAVDSYHFRILSLTGSYPDCHTPLSTLLQVARLTPTPVAPSDSIPFDCQSQSLPWITSTGSPSVLRSLTPLPLISRPQPQSCREPTSEHTTVRRLIVFSFSFLINSSSLSFLESNNYLQHCPTSQGAPPTACHTSQGASSTATNSNQC